MRAIVFYRSTVFLLILSALVACESRDTRAFRKAGETNTIDAYEGYLQEFPEGKNRSSAVDSIYMLVVESQDVGKYKYFVETYSTSELVNDAFDELYQIVKNTGSAEMYDTFVTEFPYNKYSVEAYKWLYSLIDGSNTIDDYDRYISNYPNSPYVEQAENKIYNLIKDRGFSDFDLVQKIRNSRQNRYGQSLAYDDLLISIADKEYQKVKRLRSISALEDYMSSVPSEYYFDAKEQVEKLKWASPASAWSLVQENPSYDNLKKYVSLFPNSQNARKAEKTLVDREVDNIMRGQYGDLPPMQATSRSNSTTATLNLKNDTSYNLSIYFSSNQHSKRVTIRPHSSSTIIIPVGSYRIAASVDAPRVSPYAGNDYFQGGSYSSSFYIVTERHTHYN